MVVTFDCCLVVSLFDFVYILWSIAGCWLVCLFCCYICGVSLLCVVVD